MSSLNSCTQSMTHHGSCLFICPNGPSNRAIKQPHVLHSERQVEYKLNGPCALAAPSFDLTETIDLIEVGLPA